MKYIFPFLILFTISFICKSQYKNDNVLYKTVYVENLCDSFKKYPDRLIIDVRSPAEYNEETMKGMSGHSLGHFKTAINIDVQQLGKHFNEINAFKDKPVFIICSHSQRSRRASLFLAQNGFTNVLNINGGMTSIHQMPRLGNECVYDQITTILPYKLLSPSEMCEVVNDKNSFIVDIRPACGYSTLTMEETINYFGMFKKAVSIPMNVFDERKNEIPRDKKIIITDITGDHLDEAAAILISNGYTEVNILSGGMEQFITTDSKKIGCRNELKPSSAAVQLIGSADLLNVIEKGVSPLFLDIRPAKEFTNTSIEQNKNIGHLIGAVNVPVEDLPFKLSSIFTNKETPVIIYSFSSDPDIYKAGKLFLDQGFKHIFILSRGIFNVRWTANNFKEYRALSDLIADVPAENL